MLIWTGPAVRVPPVDRRVRISGGRQAPWGWQAGAPYPGTASPPPPPPPVLCCVVLCCVVMCCVVLCCVVLCCAVPCCAVLCCAVLCCCVLCCALLCCAVLLLCCDVAVLCCALLRSAVLCCPVSCRAVPCCAVLCCAVLYCAEGAVTRRQWPGCLPTGTGKREGCVYSTRAVCKCVDIGGKRGVGEAWRSPTRRLLSAHKLPRHSLSLRLLVQA